MKVSTKSWSYRFNSWCEGSIDNTIESMNSCQYIRYTILNALKGIGIVGLIAFGIAALSLAVFFALSILVGYVALILGPVVGYSDWLIGHGVYDSGIFAWFIGSIVAIVAGAIHTFDRNSNMHFWPDYLKPKFKQSVKQEKVPSVWKQHLKNMKDKVCTQVEIVEEGV